MSMESAVRVVELPKIGKHPNADTLSIVQVQGGYPCIFKSGTFEPGDKAVYIPVDSMIPVTEDTGMIAIPALSFLKSRRIKAMRLRGIFSMGLLIPLKELYLAEDTPVGAIVTDQLGITKYEPQIDNPFWKNGDAAPDPGVAPVFEVEGLRMFPDAFKGKRVHVTEKIHGTNFRAVWHEDRLHVGSHRTWLKKGANTWWNVAQNWKLEERLFESEFAFYGEIYGPKIQDLTYGAHSPQVIFYDVMRKDSGTFLPPDETQQEIERLDLQYVPVVYEDYWDEKVKMLAEGESLLNIMNSTEPQIREGIVIRPLSEEFSPELGGRLILKLCGEGYYTRKEK